MKSRVRHCALVVAVATAAAVTAPLPASAQGPILSEDPVSTADVDPPYTELILGSNGLGLAAVDPVGERIYHSLMINADFGVDVLDLTGNLVHRFGVEGQPQDLLFAPEASAMYLTESYVSVIRRIDTETLAVNSVALPDGQCPRSMARSGGKLWYTFTQCGSSEDTGFGVYDPATGTVTSLGALSYGEVFADPDRPDRLVFLDAVTDTVRVVDVSSGTPAVVATTAAQNCTDAAFLAGGDEVAVACDSDLMVFDTATLTDTRYITVGGTAVAVEASTDGRFIAAGGAFGTDGAVVTVVDASTTDELGRYVLPGSARVLPDALTFAADGRLFAMTRWGSTGETRMYTIAEATKYATAVTVDAPRNIDYGEELHGTGTVEYGTGGMTLDLTRVDRVGTHPLGTVTVTADGTFEFTDAPLMTGPITYRLSYPGDDRRQAATASAEVMVRPLPYDFDADGYAETVVGAPGEDIGADTDTGMFHILPGSSQGVDAAGENGLDQDSAGVPGSNEDADLLGYTNAGGDFNGDGYGDLAVAQPGEDIDGYTGNGNALVFYGSANGLLTTNVTSIYVPASTGAGEHLGVNLAAGDFNGDGKSDLAAGAAYDGSGRVYAFYGTETGLSKTGYDTIDQSTYGVPGRPDTNDLFGWAIAAGDVDADGRDDLAVGAVYDWEDLDWSTGSVTVVYGTDQGLSGTDAQRFSEETAGMPGGAGTFDPDTESSDRFGNDLVLADLDGDGDDDLVVGAPGAPVTVDGTRKPDAGTVTILYSDGTRIGTEGAELVTESTGGIPGSAGKYDFFGATIAAGDADADGYADLAVYSPGDTYVSVIPGGPDGPRHTDAKGWTQNTAGIPGSSEDGDLWGNSLRFSNVDGSGRQALIVGADGENNGAGAITVIYTTADGLTASGSEYISQNTSGVEGTPESGDGFGTFY